MLGAVVFPRKNFFLPSCQAFPVAGSQVFHYVSIVSKFTVIVG